MSDNPQRYFEEFLLRLDDGVTWPKCLGVRVQVGNPSNRTLGYYGKMDIDLTEPFELQKGHRVVRYKASKKKPVKVFTMLQKLEGRDRE